MIVVGFAQCVNSAPGPGRVSIHLFCQPSGTSTRGAEVPLPAQASPSRGLLKTEFRSLSDVRRPPSRPGDHFRLDRRRGCRHTGRGSGRVNQRAIVAARRHSVFACFAFLHRPTSTVMTTVLKDYIFTRSALILAAVLLAGCTTTDRSERPNDCAKARSRYSKMKRTVQGYYSAGTTSSAQIAIAERRLSKARRDYESACGRGSRRRAN